MNRHAEHEPLRHFSVADGCLLVGGVPVTTLAERAGPRPFYVYDRDVMTVRVRALRKALPEEISIHYAVKANPMPAVVQHFVGLVDGMDVASVRELRLALNARVCADDISFAGPGKVDEELAAAVSANITVNLESENELERIEEQGARLGRTPVVAVRVNPDFELKSSGMKMGGGPKPFGVDAEVVPPLVAKIIERGLRFRGFHIFCGSQNLSVESINEAQEKTFDLAARLAEQTSAPLDSLNIGGGFGIPYFPGDRSLEIDRVGDRLKEILSKFRRRLPDAKIVIELGRYLVGEAGVYVCKVVDRKVSRGHTFLVTNGGLHHHLAASGNFGQVIRKNYPIAVANRMGAMDLEEVSVVGPLCTPLDILGSHVRLPKASVGDLIAVFQSGAYGFTASPVNFLSHPPPEEIIVG
jgi:diaminopimelate decarboxylase